jgi:hypothetical protein
VTDRFRDKYASRTEQTLPRNVTRDSIPISASVILFGVEADRRS